MKTLEGVAAAEYVANTLASRPAVVDPAAGKVAARIVEEIRRKGDKALLGYARKFDGLAEGQPLKVSREEMAAAWKKTTPGFRRALRLAAKNIRQFAQWQKPKPWMRTLMPGLKVGQKVEPLASAGCYAPGGRYPLPSSILMTAIPAQVAGVQRIQVASPRPAPETLAAAHLLGIENFYRIGGAQAIAAFAYGTESVPAVDKITGPGNSFVAAAKKLVSFDCAIDFLAGPTEIVYVAHKGDAACIASDLVAQAEHDPLTLAIFITSSKKLARAVEKEAFAQAAGNPIALTSLTNRGLTLIAKNRAQAMEWANQIGAEHITIDAEDLRATVSAGSIFVGPYSPQSLGDYASGPNHTLPTGNVARFRGGLSVYDYLKLITVQQVSRAALGKIGPAVIELAEAEGLHGHANSVRVRLEAER
jgi:histidinol dehydrogenase